MRWESAYRRSMLLNAFTNIFAGNPLDRACDRRTNPDWVNARLNDPQSLTIVLWNGAPLVMKSEQAGVQLTYLSSSSAGEILSGIEQARLFLGLWKDAPVFAIDLDSAADPSEGPLHGYGQFEDLRGLALQLSSVEAAISAMAKAVFEWHRRHRHCSVCGKLSGVMDGGWKRVCPSCGAEHFPRTDPVVIMLPVRGENCLLGRQASWPAGMWAALAGFMEPGESIEEACARELKEETALDTASVTYHSSQPWPFPSSLMIGLIAEVLDGDAIPDKTELEALRWFTRSEAKKLLNGDIEGAFAPPRSAIAHKLINAWAKNENIPIVRRQS